MLFYLKHTLYVFKYQYIGLKYQIYNNIADNQDHLGMPSKRKKTEMWDIVPKGGRGSKPDPKFFIMFKWDIEG